MERCPYITGRLCLLRKAFSTARFCRKECGHTNADKLRMRNRGVLADRKERLPDAGELQRWYAAKKNKGCGGKCGKVKAIVKGFGKLAWERITKGKPDEETIRRSAICAECEHRTFLNVVEWAVGAFQADDLPINHEPGEWDALWCSKCKCCIEAKIRATEAECPLGKWELIEDD